MRRRNLLALLGSTAVAWPQAILAQQPERMRRVGVLMNFAADDREGQARVAAFLQGLRELAWIEGRNVQINTRWAGSSAEQIRKFAAE